MFQSKIVAGPVEEPGHQSTCIYIFCLPYLTRKKIGKKVCTFVYFKITLLLFCNEDLGGNICEYV